MTKTTTKKKAAKPQNQAQNQGFHIDDDESHNKSRDNKAVDHRSVYYRGIQARRPFKSKTTVTSAKAQQRKKNTTTAKARPETTVAEKPAESGTMVNCEQRILPLKRRMCRCRAFRLPVSADDAVAVVKGEQIIQKQAERKQ